MADATPDPTPDTPQEQRPPDGWELMCTGVMRSEFGRRSSRALNKAMMQLSAEQAWVEGRAEVARVNWWRRLQEAFFALPISRVAAGLAVIGLIAAVLWVLEPFGTHQPGMIQVTTANCRISDALDAHWSGATGQLKQGEILPEGQLRLESGVVELTFASGARAAVEGPAELKITDRNSVELQSGKMSAEVPHSAIGFTVKTPNATVTDLGTRFGVDTKTKDSSVVDVFEGKVQVTQGTDATAPDNQWNLTRNMAMVLDARGGVTTAAAPESAFPQPGHSVLIRPANCGFDAMNLAKIGGFPSDQGFWSGAAYALTKAVGDVRPVQGGGMLRFLAPPQENGGAVDSVVWQIVDMRGAKDFIAANGMVDLKAWVQFNRVAGDSHSASKFRISVA
ncbi:MAG TPA: FecR family protein, partial [Verrucomicrobiae bacterium]|nr:FecR family protein [Verrucomicrobiae bacterium]